MPMTSSSEMIFHIGLLRNPKTDCKFFLLEVGKMDERDFKIVIKAIQLLCKFTL